MKLLRLGALALIIACAQSPAHALSFRNESGWTMTLVGDREGTDNYQVITSNLGDNNDSREVALFLAARGERVNRLRSIILYPGEAGTDNQVPLSTLTKANLPSGGIELELVTVDRLIDEQRARLKDVDLGSVIYLITHEDATFRLAIGLDNPDDPRTIDFFHIEHTDEGIRITPVSFKTERRKRKKRDDDDDDE